MLLFFQGFIIHYFSKTTTRFLFLD
jgi:hypothetical protein